jgi:putative acetyltransferase
VINIREENSSDIEGIYYVNKLAFKGESEAKLVNSIRKTQYFIPKLSLVAEKDNLLVGHLLLSEVVIETSNGPRQTLALAPMAVLPNYQNKGIGSQLVREGLAQANKLNYESVVVLGHANFYPKFGFTKASLKGIKPPFEVPDEAFMILELKKGALKNIEGTVTYTEPFLQG